MNAWRLPTLTDDPLAPFPPTSDALLQPNGLLAWGGGLEPERLLRAYRQGIFPWYSQGETILWWTPAPRCVIFPPAVRISRRTRRRLRSGCYRVTADSAFREVIGACAAPRKGEAGTWITSDMQRAFNLLYRRGHAHSVEVWQDERLVGGLYGLALGRVFFGESMFSRAADASKIALITLCRQLQAWQFGLLDCQVPNPHLLSMGAVHLGRAEFESMLADLTPQPGRAGSWRDCFAADAHW